MAAQTAVLDLIHDWTAGEEGNDAERLDALLTDDFAGVGPLGFVLGRKQWLERFRKGLENHKFAVEEPQVRDYGGAAVVVGVLAQETSLKGEDKSGRFRVTLVAVRPDDRWRLAHLHIGVLQEVSSR
ncbi:MULTISPECIES: SgcJ/EcaC family oxidoreductase [unclassified Streptomyces]|uniref:SgcJ/EcaC family oxidoreductase n=1 Tax=unclassified Streptomyces TaxID=2593676 RepID=UPI00224FBF9F|nr:MULTISPECIES: SgcJ/EcaC family oxidoreductase [unclassified Streptomyces]MCX5337203.1 nuclear transport factor 2 family protein [Streptomyces sp. NBC_00140]MCX5365846.1 nuclear transport factor 2 family protein [Streptomyces sp. NBC_00124]